MEFIAEGVGNIQVTFWKYTSKQSFERLIWYKVKPSVSIPLRLCPSAMLYTWISRGS